jgi:hypothetical protein
MGENHETKWERLSNGERVELGLVQIDIVGHSRINASERTLKFARDILCEETERIAVAYGGKRFAWAGDGGIFMFLTGDGEGFNTLINAALEMLNGMSAINKRIADETDLRNPIHVRLSCDSGTAAFDQDPTRITADFINQFTKNERTISIADTVCITERVYKQLDSQLRARFSLYKHSPEIHGNIYSLTRRKFPPRWKHVVSLVLVGMALGLICAAMLARNGLWLNTYPSKAENGNVSAPISTPNSLSNKEQNNVYLFGSGTVYTYLIASDLDIFKKLKEKEDVNVEIMQGPTGTAASIFKHGFDQMPYPILVMASRRLKIIDDLSQSEEKPRAVFEAYLGADALQMLLVTGNKHAKDTSALEAENISALKEAFPGLFSNSSEDRLAFATLAKNEKWKGEKYSVYVGSSGAGTIDVWKKHLDGAWPKELGFWDIRSPQQIIELAPASRIYLGSEVLNNDPAATLKSNGIFYGRLTMVDDSKKPAKRGLYLYGFVNTAGQAVAHGPKQGYDLPKPIVLILKYVFDSLKD